MEKAEQHIQSEYIRNASILLNWNDIRNASILLNWNDIRNADMNELYEMLGRLTLIVKDMYIKLIEQLEYR